MDTALILAIASIFTSVMIPLFALRSKATVDQIEQLTRENARLSERLKKEEDKTESRDKRIEDVLAQNTDLSNRLEQALDRVHDLEAENTKLSVDLENAVVRVKQLEDDNTVLQEQVAKLVAQMEEAGLTPSVKHTKKAK